MAEITIATGSFTAIANVIKFYEFYKQIEEVPQEDQVFLNLIKLVHGDLVQAIKLRNVDKISTRLEVDTVSKGHIDDAILQVRKALNAIGECLAVRVDGKVSFRDRFRWVVSDHQRLRDRTPWLTTTHSRLLYALQDLRRMASENSLPVQSPLPLSPPLHSPPLLSPTTTGPPPQYSEAMKGSTLPFLASPSMRRKSRLSLKSPEPPEPNFQSKNQDLIYELPANDGIPQRTQQSPVVPELMVQDGIAPWMQQQRRMASGSSEISELPAMEDVPYWAQRRASSSVSSPTVSELPDDLTRYDSVTQDTAKRNSQPNIPRRTSNRVWTYEPK